MAIAFTHGDVAEWLRQGPAKPCIRVRFPASPPLFSLTLRELCRVSFYEVGMFFHRVTESPSLFDQ